MDAGADGIIVPMVNNSEDAQNAVNYEAWATWDALSIVKYEA